jgi:RNA polymerase sigma factor (TIGR02999 family)
MSSSGPLPPEDEVTALLAAWREGAAGADERLLERVYGELRRLARAQLRREAGGRTLDPTGLVHEAYLRLLPQSGTRWQNRSHFFAIAATMMRRILVDRARARAARKRQNPEAITLSEPSVPGRRVELLDLDRALDELARDHPRAARVVELRYFAGLEVTEIAEVLGVTDRTIKRDWSFAKAWLAAAIDPDAGSEPA